MATFAAHVHVHRESGPVQFAPGDELPEWAEGLVGKHCLAPEDADARDFTAREIPPAGADEDGEGDSEDAGVSDPDDADDADSDKDEGEGESEAVGDAGESDNVDPAAKADVPDFTAPAPRRGRPRKA